MSIKKVNIRPGVSILSVLKHLNYKPWFALAEFVDNSIDSYLRNRDLLNEIDGSDYKLEVKIEVDIEENRITIVDNAAGIQEQEYERAFRPAELPPEEAKLSEFGMGMKSAACWFSNNWKVRTKALNEEIAREIHFDIVKIVDDKIEELDISQFKENPKFHYTRIDLQKVSNLPVKRSLSKVKEHLKSIYRQYIRDEQLVLYFNNELLVYDEPQILVAPFYKDESGDEIAWRKDLDLDFGDNLRATGFAALREKGTTKGEAGFALFRNGRVIEGSADEGFRPEFIFGSSNSFRSQRLIGELHLEGFEVSHTKDGFRWDDNMDVFLEFLKEELEKEPLDLLAQAEGFRKKPKFNDVKDAALGAISGTASILENETKSQIDKLRDEGQQPSEPAPLSENKESIFKNINIDLKNEIWNVHIELSYNPAISRWYEIGDHLVPDDAIKSQRNVGIRLSLIHPFMVNFIGNDDSRLMPILRIVSGLGISEIIARESGLSQAGEIRRLLNELIDNPLSKRQ